MSTVNEQENMASEGAPAQVQMKEPTSKTFEGKIVSVTGRRLVMTNKDGKEYTHQLATDATVTRDGTACKAEDLKAGARIRVTTSAADRKVASGVESLDKYAEFAQCGS